MPSIQSFCQLTCTWRGMKVVVTTDRFAPTLSQGAVGTVAEIFDHSKIVSFSGNRLYILQLNEMREATPQEIEADLADVDQDQEFNPDKAAARRREKRIKKAQSI